MSITVTDNSGDTGNDTGTGSLSVTVNNVVPTVVISGALLVNESQDLVTYSFNTTDPGTRTRSPQHADCGASGTFVA